MTGEAVKRVAVLLPSLLVGGAEQLVLEELRALKDEAGFAFEVLLLFEPGALAAECAELGVKVKCWNTPHTPWSVLLGYLRVISYLRRQRFGVLHCHLLYLLGPWCGVLAGVTKTLATVHTKKPMSLLERLALQRCDTVFACGRQVQVHLDGFWPPLRTQLLTNAVGASPGAEISRERARRMLQVEPKTKLLVSVGRLIADKGYDTLVQAMQHVLREVPSVLLMIAGEGEQRARLEQQIVAAGLESAIRLLGTVRPVAPLLAAADLVVNSSRREGVAISLIEAMAQGRAIVATQAGGNADVVLEDVTGLLVPVDQPQVLSEAIVMLLHDDQRRERYERAALERFRRDFDIQTHCNHLLAEYRNANEVPC